MTSSIHYGTSGLGIHFSPQETKAHSMGLESHTMDSEQKPILGGCSTDELGLTLTPECQQSPRCETVEHRPSSDTDANAKCYKSSGSAAHDALSVNDNERDWKGSEIDTVLGNAKSRLKSGTRLLPQAPGEQRGVALEKAKRRASMNADILLSNDICVEGGYLQGLVKLQIKKRLKKSQSVLLSGGKIRVFGFESTTEEEERFTFYQFCVDLSDVASGLDAVYYSEPDADGFIKAAEGVHILPFTFQLTSSRVQGTPKGPMHAQSGASVRYIAMVSFRIKDAASGKMSVAHFYRDCSVWPRLNPSIVLAPTSRPIQVTVSDDVEMGGNGKVTLTASLHRLHWVAGQLCHVRFDVVNASKKTLKLLSLELFQTITTFRTKTISRDVQSNDNKEDTFQSTATQKQIAHSTLTIREVGTRGHASAKGWWMGVAAGSSQIFSHSILLPACALSIPQGKLLEVSYTLRATISPGSFLSTNVNVSIPLEIINFLSIDPPPRIGIELDAKHAKTKEWQRATLSVAGDGLPKANDENGSTEFEDNHISEYDSDGLGSLSVHDDTDEVVKHVVSSAKIDEDDAPRFADLYYSLREENPRRESDVYLAMPVEGKSTCGVFSGNSSNQMNITTIIQHQEPKKPSSFPARVEEKMAKRKNTLNEAMHVIKVPIHGDVTQGALTTAEQDLSDSRRDRFREESLVSLSAYPPAGLSLLLSETSARKPPTPPSTWNNVDSIVTTSATTRVSTMLPIYNENKSSGSTEKGILQVPLTDSHSTIRSREISINDMIDTYIQPSQAKKNLLHTMAPLQQDSQDTPNADTTGNSRACREQSNLMTPTRRLSTDTLATSRPRSKSVKDKIRELEELAAKASGKF